MLNFSCDINIVLYTNQHTVHGNKRATKSPSIELSIICLLALFKQYCGTSSFVTFIFKNHVFNKQVMKFLGDGTGAGDPLDGRAQ